MCARVATCRMKSAECSLGKRSHWMTYWRALVFSNGLYRAIIKTVLIDGAFAAGRIGGAGESCPPLKSTRPVISEWPPARFSVLLAVVCLLVVSVISRIMKFIAARRCCRWWPPAYYCPSSSLSGSIFPSFYLQRMSK